MITNLLAPARRRVGTGGWTAVVAVVAALVVLPVVVVAGSVLTPTGDVWAHLWATRLPGMLWATAGLLVGVGAGTLVLGGGLAWLVTAHEFPGRRVLEWLLMLPLAMPAYILGFVFLALLGFTGPVQGLLRAVFGAGVALPEVRSLWGATVVLVLTLYPYVYLLARAALREQAATAYQVARTLGSGPLEAARRVVLPLARPSLAAGLTLVGMETLTDFATVQYFNVDTVSVGVFRVWKGMFDRGAAGELASVVLLFALGVLLAERALRGRARYDQPGGTTPGIPRTPLPGWRRWAATGTCAAVLGVAFVAPVAQLLVWSGTDTITNLGGLLDPRYLGYLTNSGVLAGLSAAVCLVAAVLVSNATRFSSGRTTRVTAQLTTLGYAVPGPVIAIGVLLVLTGADQALRGLGLPTPGLVVTGSVVGLVYAYAVRFLALGFTSVDASLQKVPEELTATARSLGSTPVGVVRRVHLPLTRAGVLVAALLVVVEALKELPIVLLLRPFGFDTLSVWVWQLAGDSRWAAAAVPALTIVAVSLVPVAILFRRLAAAPGAPPRPDDRPPRPDDRPPRPAVLEAHR